MFNTTIIGKIAGGSVAPKELEFDSYTKREFTLIVKDYTKKPKYNDYKKAEERPVLFFKVVLPDGERFSYLFNFIKPGKRVMIRGMASCRPEIVGNSARANLEVQAEDVQFLDTEMGQQVRNVMRLFKREQILGETEAEELKERLLECV